MNKKTGFELIKKGNPGEYWTDRAIAFAHDNWDLLRALGLLALRACEKDPDGREGFNMTYFHAGTADLLAEVMRTQINAFRVLPLEHGREERVLPRDFVLDLACAGDGCWDPPATMEVLRKYGYCMEATAESEPKWDETTVKESLTVEPAATASEESEIHDCSTCLWDAPDDCMSPHGCDDPGFTGWEPRAALDSEREAEERDEITQVETAIGVLYHGTLAAPGSAFSRWKDDAMASLATLHAALADREKERQALVALVERIDNVVPYVTATLHNSKIGDESEWFQVHAGRAHSSIVQLENLRSEGRAAMGKKESPHA